MPPPLPTGAELPLKVLLDSASVPPLLLIPPPLSVLVLFPVSGALPFLIVRPLMVTFAPKAIPKTRVALLPFTASTPAPGPFIVRSTGRVSFRIENPVCATVLARGISPLRPAAKLMESVSPLTLALLTASLSVHGTSSSVVSQPPMVPGFSVLSTVKVSAWAALAVRSRPRQAATNTATTQKARVLALPAHVTIGAGVLIICPSPYSGRERAFTAPPYECVAWLHM